jgi:hypothetical protein
MVAQVDEQHAAMVADAMAPAGKPDGRADVAVAELAAGVGAVAVHERTRTEKIGAFPTKGRKNTCSADFVKARAARLWFMPGGEFPRG